MPCLGMDQSKTLKNMHDLHEICDKYFELGLSEITVTRTSTQGMHDYEFAKFVKIIFQNLLLDSLS